MPSIPSNTHEIKEPKRRKVRSCTTCRRQKARCEFTSNVDKCHRCNVLNISCVIDPDAQANILVSSSHPRASQSASSKSTISGHLQNGSETQPSTSIEERLAVMEEALRQVLQATGLPSLESISNTLGAIKKTHQNSQDVSFSEYSLSALSIPSGLDSIGYTSSSRLDCDKAPAKLYPTPIEQGIITTEQSNELTAIFEMRYNHCVYTPILKSHRMTLDRPFTFTVMCALALRLKTTIPNQNEVRLRVFDLLQGHLTTAMGVRPYTIDAVHGLLLMSLWSSVLTCGDQRSGTSIVPDGWLLLGTAIRMAQALRLDRSAAEVEILASQGKSSELSEESAKVWYALIAYDLATSLASARPKLINPVPRHHSRAIMDSLSTSPTDRCLMYHLDALTLANGLHDLHPPTSSEHIPSYILKVDSMINSLELLASQAYEISMSVLDDPEACLEYRVFRLYRQYCGCLCLTHACGKLAIFADYEGDSSDCDEQMKQENDVDVSMQIFSWVNRLCEMAEAVINEAFPESTNESIFLSTAPDHLFTAVAFCAAALIQGQGFAIQSGSIEPKLIDHHEEIVERTIDRLCGLSLPDSELPRRYGRGLAVMLKRHRKNKDDRRKRQNMELGANIGNRHHINLGEYDLHSISNGTFSSSILSLTNSVMDTIP